MGAFGEIGSKVRERRGCNCCMTSKPPGAPKGPCAGCVAAGCEFRCGNWFRGTGKNKDGSSNGRPLCPARLRSKKGGDARTIARRMAAAGGAK